LTQHIPHPGTPLAEPKFSDRATAASCARAATGDRDRTNTGSPTACGALVSLARLLGRLAAQEHVRAPGGMTMSTTKPGSGTDRPERTGTAAKPICRRLFDIEQAADFAGVPVRVICRWIRMGKLEAYHLGGARVRIEEVELADLIASADSDRPPRQGKADRSGPWFVNAGIWRS
jgi:excisionase family DNA binding protein